MWVGNVDPQHLNEKSLTQLFSKVGKVVNVKILPEKYCAFINYANPEDTVRAIEKLQVCSAFTLQLDLFSSFSTQCFSIMLRCCIAGLQLEPLN